MKASVETEIKNIVQFLSVVLEIRSKTDLGLILGELGGSVLVLHCGQIGARHLLAVENAGRYNNPCGSADTLCSLVEKLSPVGRRVWDRAQKRFDLGFGWSVSQTSSQVSLRPETLLRIARLGAGLTMTFYRGIGSDARGAALSTPPWGRGFK